MAKKASIQIQENRVRFEWNRLGYSLQRASHDTLSRFCTCLQIIGLGVLGPSRSKEQVLALDEHACLLIFTELDNGVQGKPLDFALADHVIALCRALLEELGGDKDHLQHRQHAAYSPKENLCILGAVIGAAGNHDLRSYKAESLHSALSQSISFAARTLTIREVRYLHYICLKVSERTCQEAP
ncbi:hypothetical protein FSARC_9923 [Fusarium sarcochroum]|uniref:Uncharacterized protein n=1 Tax=Fusarium sarcochroum TaxID=1208366 RepID=A0A8H4X4W2_9HYPO|nr:hypothetical protein FSARC_9923 [Fusarium sarcochroum]